MTTPSIAILPVTFRVDLRAENLDATDYAMGMAFNQRKTQMAGFLRGPRFLLSGWAVDHASHRDHHWRMRCLAGPLSFKSPMLCFEQAGAFPVMSFVASADSIIAVHGFDQLRSDSLNAQLDAMMAAHLGAFEKEIAASGCLWTPWREARLEYGSGRASSKTRDLNELNDLDDWRYPDTSLIHAIDACAFALNELIELGGDVDFRRTASLRSASI